MKPKRPRDANQLAKFIVDLTTGDAKEKDPYEGKNPAAVELGRKGGLKGGKARAEKLSPAQLSKIGKKGAAAKAAKRPPAASAVSPASDSRPVRQKKKRRAVIQVPED